LGAIVDDAAAFQVTVAQGIKGYVIVWRHRDPWFGHRKFAYRYGTGILHVIQGHREFPFWKSKILLSVKIPENSRCENTPIQA